MYMLVMNFDANEAIFIPTNNILFRERSYYPENLQRQSVAIVYPLLTTHGIEHAYSELLPDREFCFVK